MPTGSLTEVPLLMRRWQGVNIAHDAPFVDPSFLQRADNWVPDPTFRLTKRRGTVLYVERSTPTVDGELILRTYDETGGRYFYAIEKLNTMVRQVIVSANDGAFSVIGGDADFTETSALFYGAAVLGGTVYFGNGVDPLKAVTIGGTGVDLVALATTNETGQSSAATAATATAPQLDPGTYAYTWAVYNTSTERYVSRGIPRTQAIIAGQFIRFGAPTTALGANEVYLLFVAPRNLPLEFAHVQFPDGHAASATTIDLNSIRADTSPVPSANQVTRTGSILLAHRSRLWVAGDVANPNDVYATDIILPGLEQSIFDRGDFFPANAVLAVNRGDGDIITGLGVASVTGTNISPSAALIIYKNHSTWALFGDILDDPNATLVQLSGTSGCIAPRSVVHTPVGLICCGHDGVYLIRPETLIPVNIGLAIEPAIRAIPRNRRVDACAIYHKGFYKLAITPAGFSTNVQQWWLDLRFGLGTAPSWWGPHTASAYKSFTTGQREPNEDDRAWGLREVPNVLRVLLTDQPGVYADDGATIISRMRTKAIDGGNPFIRKLFKRARIFGFTTARSTSISVEVVTDDATTWAEPPIFLEGAVGARWNIDKWNVGRWGSGRFREGESIFNAARPRGQYAEVKLTHNDRVRVDIRDFELRYESQREVADYTQSSGTTGH